LFQQRLNSLEWEAGSRFLKEVSLGPYKLVQP
jgi:hypothetical protein